ncbi:slipin family protein [Aureibacter tunicatorum]|uniref:Regulator of protease activity HflC (Stomatin/prohibitin superfamily) n=1 Tax=Aureibacter tunicatorum TaxID=866807 RepID=A0AAE4BTX3_9BACT|nr:slipin family protein [Aureibacter tunicatorum]MDR6240385.1 regulator of protease activity HflC (stomatin/prohibitin superfamily) [Aureibacter tunicatorum]BDD05734.1 peptidase [Aureibacter tunicatorum]
MKPIKINEGNIGMIFKSGDFNKLLKAGKHWISFNDSVEIHNMAKPFQSDIPLNVLLKHDDFKNAIEVIEVNDDQLVLRYEDGAFSEVLRAGKYAYWKGIANHSFQYCDLKEARVPAEISLNVLKTMALKLLTKEIEIQPFEKALLYIDGKLDSELKQGAHYFWSNSKNIQIQRIDTRTQTLEISGQEILTQDKVNLRINFSAQYQVYDIYLAREKTKEFETQLYQMFQLALREYVGTLPLDELLAKKESVSEFIINHLSAKTKEIGVRILDCGVRDLILPGEVKEIMNQVLIAQKKAQANIITRREETASTRSLLNTAKLMEDNPMLFKLKEMEYVEKISEKISEITLSNGGQIIDQLRGMFGTAK